MIFSSISFLFFFLPLLLLIYYLLPRKFRNIVLLIFSLIFYYFGEKWYVILLIASCLTNFLIGIALEKNEKKIYLILGLIINLGLLIYFKYTNFFLSSFSNLFNLNINSLKIVLPLGISFFTFQNISYLIDVYRKDVESSKNFLNYATYIALFPQLVAGPIVRYKDVTEEIKKRKESLSLFSEGIRRFTIGLGKKVLIADTIYNLYTRILTSELSVLTYWLVGIFFTLQIYFDFSGYSDMAIGLGKIFGFNFKENFDHPLVSPSVTTFWRRWHMSLSSFFRDYIYIPLGGNRVSKIKHIRNIFIVWLLTGLWHGASWNFVAWGLYFFVFLILEKFFLSKYLKGGIFSYIYTFIIVIISFVIFSITDFNEIITFLKGMIGFNAPIINMESIYYLKISLVTLLISLIGMSKLLPNLVEKMKKGIPSKIMDLLEIAYISIIFVTSIATILSSTFTPFIYFRF